MQSRKGRLQMKSSGEFYMERRNVEEISSRTFKLGNIFVLKKKLEC